MVGRVAMLLAIDAALGAAVLAQAAPSGDSFAWVAGPYALTIGMAIAIWWLVGQVKKRDDKIDRLTQTSHDLATAALAALKQAGKE